MHEQHFHHQHMSLPGVLIGAVLVTLVALILPTTPRQCALWVVMLTFLAFVALGGYGGQFHDARLWLEAK